MDSIGRPQNKGTWANKMESLFLLMSQAVKGSAEED